MPVFRKCGKSHSKATDCDLSSLCVTDVNSLLLFSIKVQMRVAGTWGFTVFFFSFFLVGWFLFVYFFDTGSHFIIPVSFQLKELHLHLPPKLELKVFVTIPGLHSVFYCTRQPQKWDASHGCFCDAAALQVSFLADIDAQQSMCWEPLLAKALTMCYNLNIITLHAQLGHTQMELLVLVPMISRLYGNLNMSWKEGSPLWQSHQWNRPRHSVFSV